jgi:hypothetical protein
LTVLFFCPCARFFDSGTYAPEVDTHLELVLPALRAANPETVVQVRDGGVWRDFTEVRRRSPLSSERVTCRRFLLLLARGGACAALQTDDHSETEVDSLLGVSYLRPGDAWEVSRSVSQ